MNPLSLRCITPLGRAHLPALKLAQTTTSLLIIICFAANEWPNISRQLRAQPNPVGLSTLIR